MSMKTMFTALLLASAASVASVAIAAPAASLDPVEIKAVSATGTGASHGTVTIEATKYGVVFTPKLSGLEPGVHGFHVHEKGSCAPDQKDGKPVPALAAGGHYDPAKTGKHDLPWGAGHRGDLPPLFVDAAGNASHPVLAPRLKLSELKGKSLMIHAGGDNHADHPQPLGGGGARMACAVIQ